MIRMRTPFIVLKSVALIVMLTCCAPAQVKPVRTVAVSGTAAKVVQGARKQLEKPARWTGQYYAIKYPGGDLPPEIGACSDVIVRALRPIGYDLQKLIYEHAAKHPYPSIKRRDRNIDHRRVRNQAVYFLAMGCELPKAVKGYGKDTWQPGDIVYWKLDNGQDHTGILSNSIGPSGNLMVIHNLGVVAEEDVLARWEILGHFRFPKIARSK